MPGTGLSSLRKERTATGGGGGERGSGFRKLWLKAGDRALFWFITDAEEASVPLIHLKTIPGKNGRKAWTKDVLCAKDSAEDEICPLGGQCMSLPRKEDGSMVNPGPYPRLVQYIYVETIFHTEKPLKGAENWEAVQSSAGPLWRENVNDVYLLVAKPKLQDQIIAEYEGGDPTDPAFTGEPISLVGRPYLLEHTGSGTASQDIMKRASDRALPAGYNEAKNALAPLSETVIKEFSDGFTSSENSINAPVGGYQPTTEDQELVKIDF